MELIILLAISFFVLMYREYRGQNVYKFIVEQVSVAYDKFAPYSFKVVREKTKQQAYLFLAKHNPRVF